MTPDGNCEEHLERWGLAITARQVGDLFFRVKWSNDRLDQWLRTLFPHVFNWLDGESSTPDEQQPERHWRLLKSYRNKLKKDRDTPNGTDMYHARGAAGKQWLESKIYIGQYDKSYENVSPH